MNKIFNSVLLIALLACQSKEKKDSAEADSLRVAQEKAKADSSNATLSVAATKINLSTSLPGAKGADTLYNILAHRELLQGEFGSVELITDKVLNATNPNDQRNLLAVLVMTGENEGYNTRFDTAYYSLAVFEKQNDRVKLVDQLDLGAFISHGLAVSTAKADSIMLADNRFAMVIHNKDSEEGAGDTGYRTDLVVYYVLLNDKITSIFQRKLEDTSFSSNETDSYNERTTTTTVTALPEKSKGLYNLEVRTAFATGAMTEGEDEHAQEGDPKRAEDDGVFQWSGNGYVKVRSLPVEK